MTIPLTITQLSDLSVDKDWIRANSESNIWDARWATTEESFVRTPGVQTVRIGELKRAQTSEIERSILGEDEWSKSSQIYQMMNDRTDRKERYTQLSEEEWRDSPYFSKDLTYVPGMTVGLAKLLFDRKEAEQQRMDIINRSNIGIASSFVFDFLGQLMDPMNIAASFIPIVGEARYAQWAAKYGKYGARVGKGAVEGFIGNLMVEPIVLYGSKQEQAEYGLRESLMAIAIGPAFGALTHSAGGFLVDRFGRNAESNFRAAKKIDDQRIADVEKKVGIDKTSQEARDSMLKTSVAQMAEGKAVDVEAIAKVDALKRKISDVETGKVGKVLKRTQDKVNEEVSKMEYDSAKVQYGNKVEEIQRFEKKHGKLESIKNNPNKYQSTADKLEKLYSERDALHTRLQELQESKQKSKGVSKKEQKVGTKKASELKKKSSIFAVDEEDYVQREGGLSLPQYSRLKMLAEQYDTNTANLFKYTYPDKQIKKLNDISHAEAREIIATTKDVDINVLRQKIDETVRLESEKAKVYQETRTEDVDSAVRASIWADEEPRNHTGEKELMQEIDEMKKRNMIDEEDYAKVNEDKEAIKREMTKFENIVKTAVACLAETAKMGMK